MKLKWFSLIKSEYLRNILTVMTGTTFAQAIPIAISPILTRIYSPDEFGLFAMYMAITSILMVISTGRYELAIMLPNDDDEAFQITIVSSILTIVFSIIFLIIVIVFGEDIAIILKNQEIYNWLFLIPISVLVTGLYQVFNYWHNRKKRYKEIASNRVIQTGGSALGQLGLGVFAQNIGLIVGKLIGQVMAVLYYINVYLSNDNEVMSFDRKRARLVAKKYSKFPKIDVPTVLVNLMANQAPNILLASIFNSSTAGLYYLTQRVLQSPISIISSSVLDVFKQKASEDFIKKGECVDIYKRTCKMLALIAIPLSIILYFSIVDIFVLVFGEEWREAGLYAQILMPALLLRFISNPLSFVIYIAEKQKLNFIIMLFLLVMILSSLFLAKNAMNSVIGISIAYSLYYIIHIFISARLSKVI